MQPINLWQYILNKRLKSFKKNQSKVRYFAFFYNPKLSASLIHPMFCASLPCFVGGPKVGLVITLDGLTSVELGHLLAQTVSEPDEAPLVSTGDFVSVTTTKLA